MKVGILGGTGLIGSKFIDLLLSKGHSVRLFSRSGKDPKKRPTNENFEIIQANLPETKDLENLDALVNLVGEPIAGIRWTDERKKLIRISRVDFTRGLVARLSSCKNPPTVMIQGSAVGYYGMTDQAHNPFSEEHSPAQDDLALICQDWESEVISLSAKKIRTVILRTGIVLSKEGGALAKMLLPFQMGVGGPIGTGEQGLSWIHETDMIEAMYFLLENPKLEGAFNLVSPSPTSNREFAKALGRALFRPAFLPTPVFAIQSLFGEGAKVVTHGQYVLPKRLLQADYKFKYTDLETAIRDLLKPNKSQTKP